MNDFQQRIQKFTEERDWQKFHNPKDLLLGIVEEIGEIRNVVKWEQDPKVLHEVLLKNKEKITDEIGDIYWFLALLANSVGIDIDTAIDEVIRKNEQRFPVTDVKSHHTNLFLGGKDKQYQ
ncbi:MAG: nucleotide pyrophosphohydrolase [Candidatus Kerfeldbacteria bacterium]|nr:nucleotide pyrophosphohydrolase [Candidatus Kerfeldbacteria bacterium]